ncbi:hypothetical protein GCM10022223_30620 [Kineosporia mesophila]|uniref:Uncharacterized protein n=1 Tax=Kineosporia mesophila TaxID=566012 RepID=A0ABP6ZKA5_9ACTN
MAHRPVTVVLAFRRVRGAGSGRAHEMDLCAATKRHTNPAGTGPAPVVPHVIPVTRIMSAGARPGVRPIERPGPVPRIIAYYGAPGGPSGQALNSLRCRFAG